MKVLPTSSKQKIKKKIICTLQILRKVRENWSGKPGKVRKNQSEKKVASLKNVITDILSELGAGYAIRKLQITTYCFITGTLIRTFFVDENGPRLNNSV